MSYPTGTPSDSMSGNSVWSSGVFTPNDIVARIRDNKTNIDKNAMMNSLGYQVSLVQNYINSTRVGTSSVPIETVYADKIQASGNLILESGDSYIQSNNNIRFYTIPGNIGLESYYIQFDSDSSYELQAYGNFWATDKLQVSDETILNDTLTVASTSTFNGSIVGNDSATFGSGVTITGTCQSTNFTTNGSDNFQYSSGIFTAELTPNDGATGNYSDDCKWTKIGNIITINMPSMYTNDDGDTSARYLTGLPIAIRPSDSRRCVCSLYGHNSGLIYDWYSGEAIIQTGGNIWIKPYDDGAYVYHGIKGNITYTL